MIPRSEVRIYPRAENADPDPAALLETVLRWEQAAGRPLPGDYRAFLLTSAGGFPFPACFDVAPAPWPEFLDANPQAITCFHSWPEVLHIKSDRVYRGGYPEGHLIIANAVSPLHLLMGIRDDNWGKLYLWYHSAVDWGDPVNHERDLVPVADSFAALIASLYDDGSDLARRLWLRGKLAGRAATITL